MIETALILAGIGWIAWKFRYGGPHHPRPEKPPKKKEK
jgi:hypothetical protein